MKKFAFAITAAVAAASLSACGGTAASAPTSEPSFRTAPPTPTPTRSYTPEPTPTPTQAPLPPVQDASAYAALDERTWKLITKNPEAHRGETYLVFGEVTQFDAATGSYMFRADAAHANICSYGFFNGDNAVFTSLMSPVDLSGVVEDDVFAAQVTIVGDYSYDTQIGGNTTVPMLRVDSIEVQGTCEYEY